MKIPNDADISLAAAVAEYMSLARDLRKESSIAEYRRANALAWQLAMILPADIYTSIGLALAQPDEKCNPLTVAIQVRKWLLDADAGALTAKNLLHHAPGIGAGN